MTERFNKAYNALVTAFFEGTLASGSCIACACGNIIFDAIGEPLTREVFQMEVSKYSPHDYDGELVRNLHHRAGFLWANMRSFHGGSCIIPAKGLEKHINESGYSVEEFVEIEKAFETNTKISISRYYNTPEQEILEDQYKGLCAVVDVLITLDEGKEDPDELKKKFRKHPKLVTV
jgi:hypothetical protein